MRQAWPLPLRRPWVLPYHPSLSAAAAASAAVPAAAVTPLTAKERETPGPGAFAHAARSPSLPPLTHAVLRSDSFSVQQQNNVLPSEQQLSHEKPGRKQQQIHTLGQQVPFGKEHPFEHQRQQLVRGRLLTVASHRQAAQGSALPVGGAAGATGGGVISLLRDGYSSASRGRTQVRRSLPAYDGVPWGSGSAEEYPRSNSRGNIATKRGLLLQKAASSGSRVLPPAHSSSSLQDGTLNRLGSTFRHSSSSSSSTQRRAPPPPPAVGRAASAAGGNTGRTWADGAARQQTTRAGSQKNLRVSFATDLPTKHQQQRTPRGGGAEEEAEVAADTESPAATLSEEERHFLQYGVGPTKANGWRSNTGSRGSAAVSPGAASPAGGHSTPSVSGWKFSWPPALRRRCSKVATSEGVQAACEQDQKLLLPSSSLAIRAAPPSALKPGEGAGVAAPRGVRRAAPASRKTIGAAGAGGIDASATAAAGQDGLTRTAQRLAPTQDTTPDVHAEGKARRSLLGLQRFRHRLSLPRDNAAAVVESQEQQRDAAERPSPLPQLQRSSSQLRGISTSTLGGGCSDDRSRGQPFAAAGTPSSLWLESEVLPTVSVYSAHAGAAATKEVVVAAEGGASTATAASSSSKFFWWRAEARASRTVGCSKGFAAAWQLSNSGRENTQLLQQQPYMQRLQQQSVQHLRNQVLQQQQEQQYVQGRQILQHQQFLRQPLQQSQQRQVTEQVFSKKQERACWRQTQGAEEGRGLHWPPQQPIHHSKRGAEEAADDAAEISPEVQQNAFFGFSFSLRQEQRTFFAAQQQQQAAYGSVHQAEAWQVRQPAEQLQEQQVLDQRDLPRELKQGTQYQQLQPDQQKLPLQWEQDTQQLQRQQSRSKGEERLQRQLTAHRRVPSIRSSSLPRCVAAKESLSQHGTGNLGDPLKFGAISKRGGQERLHLSSVEIVGAHSNRVYVQKTQLAKRSTFSSCDRVAAALPALQSACGVLAVAETALSSSENSDASFVYSATRRSTALAGFSTTAADSSDRLLHAASASPTVRWEHRRAVSLRPCNETPFFPKRGSPRHLRSSPGGTHTPIPSLAATVATSPLPLSSAAAVGSRPPLSVAGATEPSLGVATAVAPGITARLAPPPTVGVFAAVTGVRDADELRQTAALVGAGATHLLAGPAAENQQTGTTALRGTSGTVHVGHATPVETPAVVTAAVRDSVISEAAVTAAPSAAIGFEEDADAQGTARRTLTRTARGAAAHSASAGALRNTASTVVQAPKEHLVQKQESFSHRHDRVKWSGTEGGTEAVADDYLNKPGPARTTPGAAEFAAPGAAVNPAVSATAAACPTEALLGGRQGSAPALMELERNKSTAFEEQQAAPGAEDAGVDSLTNSCGTPAFGRKKDSDSSISRRFSLTKGIQRRRSSGGYTAGTKTSGGSSSSSSAVGSEVCRTPPPSTSLHSPRQRHKRFVPLYRFVSGWYRNRRRTRGEGHEEQQPFQRRGSQNSNSSSNSSNTSGKGSTNSSRYSRRIYRNTTTKTADEWSRKSVRRALFSSLVFPTHHSTSSAAANAEYLDAATVVPERAAAVPPAAARFSKRTADRQEGIGSAAIAARPGETSGGALATGTAAETNTTTNASTNRRSLTLHAVFSSVAAVVKRGSSSVGLTASTQKQKRRNSTCVVKEEGAALASAQHGIMAFTGHLQDLGAPLLSPLHTAKAADAASAGGYGPPAGLSRESASPPVTADHTVPDPAVGGERVEAAFSPTAAAQKTHAAEKRSAPEEGRVGGHDGREETSGGSQKSTTDNAATQGTEDELQVLKCYSLPTNEDAHVYEGHLPLELPTVLSLDSQNSSALSCHSFSSSSLSEPNVGATPAVGRAGSRTAAQQLRSGAGGRRGQGEGEGAQSEHGRDEAGPLADDEQHEVQGQDEGQWTATGAAEDEDVEGEEMEREGSLPTAGDPDETLGEEETEKVPTNKEDAAAEAAENLEGGGEPDQEKYVKEGEDGEVGLRTQGESELQEAARLRDLEGTVATRVNSAERAAQRASAAHTAAARAAVKLTTAEGVAAQRTAQARAAAARAASAREALVQAAGAAVNDSAEFEGVWVGFEGEEDAQGDNEDTGYFKIPAIGRNASVGSLRRRSTASSAGSPPAVVVEARGGRLVRGKPESAAGEPQAAPATRETRASGADAPWTGGASVPPARSRVGQARSDQAVGEESAKQHFSWGDIRYASPSASFSCDPMSLPPASAVKAKLPSLASEAAAAARVAKRASAAATGAEDVMAAAATVANARMMEAQAAERAAEETAAAADAAREAAKFEVRRRQIEERFEGGQSFDDNEGDVSDLKRYATEFLLEESVEEPYPTPVVAAAPAAHLGARERDAPLRRSSSVRRSRHQHAARHDVGAAAAQPQMGPADASSSTLQRRRSRQLSHVAGGKSPPFRRRSQVLSMEEELAAIAGEAPHLIEEDEDGAAMLARKATTENVSRRGSRRFSLVRPSREGGAAVDTAVATAGQTAAVVSSETAAAAAGATAVAGAAREVAASLAADAADAALAADAAERAGPAAVSRVERRSRQQQQPTDKTAEQGKRRGKENGREGEGGTAGFEEEEAAAAAAKGDPVEDAARETKPPPARHAASRSALQKNHGRRSSEQEQPPRWRAAGPEKREEGSAEFEAGAAERRFSAAESGRRQSWSNLAQVRKDTRTGDRRGSEKYVVTEAPRRSGDLEDVERYVEEQQRETLHRRSVQEKHLIKRLLRHRTLQSPLLTVPPPLELQNSPVMQAVYSRGEGGAADMVTKATTEQRRAREGRY